MTTIEAFEKADDVRHATHTGACFCGAVEIAISGPPLQMGYCHCESCRTYSGGPMTEFALWHAADVWVTKGADLIGHFNKLGMSDRQFCTRCGGHLMTGHPGLGFTDVRPAVLREFSFVPEMHLNYAETVMPVRDGLPKLRDFPAEAGGSGQMLAE